MIEQFEWRVRGRQVLPADHTLVMGILNVTPDSFSDGGQYLDPQAAVAAAERMVEEGADIIDIGGESTRPNRPGPVSVDEELKRIVPVLRQVRARLPHVLISVDTYKADVARVALDEGADLVNDIYALGAAPEIASLVAAQGAGLILMHMLGTPDTMQQNPRYGDVAVEIKNFLRERIGIATDAGVPEHAIVVDPGFGFGKTVEHNVELLARLEYLRLLQRPICVGVSRKSFLGALSGDLPVHEREEATLAAQCVAVMNGAAIVRCHNVRAARRALTIVDAVLARG